MTILVLAPHADDEILGVGGTMARICAEQQKVVVAVVTGFGIEPHPFIREADVIAVREECKRANELIGVSEVLFAELPAACLDTTPIWKTNKVIHEIIEEVKPDQLYAPFPHDLHKDHAAVAYGALVTARPYLSLGNQIKRVLFYETLTETHLSPPFLDVGFQPNCYVDISDYLEIKLAAMQEYKSQIQDNSLPRSVRGLTTLASFRGMHVGVEAAEAFIIARELT